MAQTRVEKPKSYNPILFSEFLTRTKDENFAIVTKALNECTYPNEQVKNLCFLALEQFRLLQDAWETDDLIETCSAIYDHLLNEDDLTTSPTEIREQHGNILGVIFYFSSLCELSADEIYRGDSDPEDNDTIDQQSKTGFEVMCGDGLFMSTNPEIINLLHLVRALGRMLEEDPTRASTDLSKVSSSIKNHKELASILSQLKTNSEMHPNNINNTSKNKARRNLTSHADNLTKAIHEIKKIASAYIESGREEFSEEETSNASGVVFNITRNSNDYTQTMLDLQKEIFTGKKDLLTNVTMKLYIAAVELLNANHGSKFDSFVALHNENILRCNPEQKNKNVKQERKEPKENTSKSTNKNKSTSKKQKNKQKNKQKKLAKELEEKIKKAENERNNNETEKNETFLKMRKINEIRKDVENELDGLTFKKNALDKSLKIANQNLKKKTKAIVAAKEKLQIAIEKEKTAREELMKAKNIEEGKKLELQEKTRQTNTPDLSNATEKLQAAQKRREDILQKMAAIKNNISQIKERQAAEEREKELKKQEAIALANKIDNDKQRVLKNTFADEELINIHQINEELRPYNAQLIFKGSFITKMKFLELNDISAEAVTYNDVDVYITYTANTPTDTTQNTKHNPCVYDEHHFNKIHEILKKHGFSEKHDHTHNIANNRHNKVIKQKDMPFLNLNRFMSKTELDVTLRKSYYVSHQFLPIDDGEGILTYQNGKFDITLLKNDSFDTACKEKKVKISAPSDDYKSYAYRIYRGVNKYQSQGIITITNLADIFEKGALEKYYMDTLANQQHTVYLELKDFIKHNAINNPDAAYYIKPAIAALLKNHIKTHPESSYANEMNDEQSKEQLLNSLITWISKWHSKNPELFSLDKKTFKKQFDAMITLISENKLDDVISTIAAMKHKNSASMPTMPAHAHHHRPNAPMQGGYHQHQVPHQPAPYPYPNNGTTTFYAPSMVQANPYYGAPMGNTSHMSWPTMPPAPMPMPMPMPQNHIGVPVNAYPLVIGGSSSHYSPSSQTTGVAHNTTMPGSHGVPVYAAPVLMMPPVRSLPNTMMSSSQPSLAHTNFFAGQNQQQQRMAQNTQQRHPQQQQQQQHRHAKNPTVQNKRY